MQIFVLGMHRSGTSTLARILNLMGCYFGSEDVNIGAAADNPKGFWERSDVIAINDHILHSAGGNWWDVALLDFGAIGADDLAWIRQRIRDTVIKLDGSRPWFIKDPRVCLTLDFWLPALERPVFIYIQRSPVQIAKSLQRRNGIPLEYGVALWEFYARSTLQSLGTHSYIPVAYETLLTDPIAAVEGLLSALAAAGVKSLRMPDRGEVTAFVQPSLCHFEDGAEADLLLATQTDLLETLRAGGHLNWDPVAQMDLRRVLTVLKQTGDWTAGLAEPSEPESGDQILEMHRARIDELLAANAALESHVAALERGLRNVTQSRAIRAFTGLYRLFALKKSGLEAEIDRIGTLLSRSGSGQPEVVRPSVLRLALTQPMRTLRLLHPSRLARALRFVLSRDGGLKKLYARYVEFHLREPKGAVHSEIVGTLIAHYGLPRKSTDARSALPSDEDVRMWSAEIRRLAAASVTVDPPTVSIVVPVYNQIRYTLACLHSIFLHTDRRDYEIIVADDCSDDQTPAVFEESISRVRYLRNRTNLGFVSNCNNAASAARGRVVVFLNNDVVVLPGWLDELVRTLDENPAIGLVGSKLIYPEGRLQEAGGIVFQDGSGWNYGRFEDADAPEYNYMRDVDYCSGASLALSRSLWEQVGGFDVRFSPAYYEDTDLAFKVRAARRRVVYQPRSQLIHFEGVSHGKSTDRGIKKHQAENQAVFQAKWEHVLASHGACVPTALPVDRTVRGRILVVDATTPTPDKDSGSLDTFNFLRIFRDCGFHVTFVPQDMGRIPGYTEDLERIGVECAHAPWSKSLDDAVRRYAPQADVVVLHRVHVARAVMDLVRACAPNARIVFDTVDLHFLREAREAELLGCSRRRSLAVQTRAIELKMIEKADAVLVRSQYEVGVVHESLPDARLHVMPIVRDIPGRGATSWEARKDVVFIGGFSHPPNVDAVKYFIAHVWPDLRAANFPGKFIIAGSNMPDEIKALAADDVITLGYVPDLAGLFDACRLTVAPLRYGAGLKGKVISSLSHGVPCVASSVAVEGSGFANGVHLLVEDEPTGMARAICRLYEDQRSWEALSEAGLAFCKENFALDVVKRKWCDVIAEVSK